MILCKKVQNREYSKCVIYGAIVPPARGQFIGLKLNRSNKSMSVLVAGVVVSAPY